MDKALNKKVPRIIICALVALAFTLGVFLSLGTVRLSARADEDTVDFDFKTEEVGISNNQFSSYTGSTFPKAPDNWTAKKVNADGTTSDSAGSADSGVMELSSYTANKDSYHLEKDYPDEFPAGTIPDSPFGSGSGFEGTNRNVLFINTRTANSGGSVVGYASSSITLAANRYYQVKAWVRTGNFDAGMGAAIRLDGLDDDVAFYNINTVSGLAALDESNNFGWKEYTFYIASSSYGSQTITLNLFVGDNYVDENGDRQYRPAVGFAMFDNVHAYQISPKEFRDFKASMGGAENDKTVADDYNILKDYSGKTSDAFSGIQSLDFTKGLQPHWTPVTAEGTDYQDINVGIYDSWAAFGEDNEYGLKSDPYSAYGKYNEDSKVLVVSSYRNGVFNAVSGGASSQKFTLERYHYYRISAWVKTQGTISGDGATLALSVIRSDDDEYTGNNIFYTKTGCVGEDEAKARGGFKQYSLYVKGSAIEDYSASVECRLTTADGDEGIAIFDNVVIEELTPEVYDSNSSNGDGTIDLDTQNGVNGEAFRSFGATGVDNGEFYLIDSYDKFEYPFSPASWTMQTPSTAGTEGYPAYDVDTDGIKSGVIPTDSETFNKYQYNFGAGAINPAKNTGNLLMLYSEKPTAFAYSSPSIAVAADAKGLIKVSLMAEGITGHGASLVLKDGANVLATIENINDTDGFKTYTFAVESDSAESGHNVTVEIWLGKYDRNNREKSLASGRLYVQKVSYETTEDDLAPYKTAYKNDKHNGSRITAAAYSYKDIDLSAYDNYDENYIKRPFNWNLSVSSGDSNLVRYGIFDASAKPQNDSSIPANFFEKATFDESNRNVLVLHNKAAAASTVSYRNSLTLAADTYYRIDVSLKVAIPDGQFDNAVGATLSLTDTKYAFKNIKDTSVTVGEIVNKEAFRKYSFYINTGSESKDVSLSISLGDGSSSTGLCSGYVYVNDISFTDITNVAYEEAETAINNGDGNYKYSLAASMADATDDEETDDSENNDNSPSRSGTDIALIIASVLFAVAILIAVVGFIIRKALEKRANKKGTVQKVATYDRAATLNREHNKNADEANKVSNVTEDNGDENYESFDDNLGATADKKESKAETVDTQATDVTEVPQATENNENADAPAAEDAEPSAEKAEETATENTADENADAQNTESVAETATESKEEPKQSPAPAPAPAPKTADEKKPQEKTPADSFIDRFDD